MRLIFEHRRALWLLLVLLALAGGRAAWTTSRSLYPAIAPPRIMIVAETNDTPARTMVTTVTRKLERAVAAIPGLVRVRSTTLRGAAELALDFAEDANLADALALARARVAETDLATSAEARVTIEQETPAIFPVVSLTVVAGSDDATALERARLAEWAETDFRPRLERLQDAFRVTVQSGDRREYVFEVDPVALAAHGLDAESIRQAIASTNVVAAVDQYDRESRQVHVVIDDEVLDHDEILETTLVSGSAGGALVRLRDLGTIVETTAVRTMIATGSGRDAVAVSVFLRDGGKITRLSQDVRDVVEHARGSVPYDGRIERVYDQSDLVEASIAGVGEAIGIGAILAVLVLFVFLGDWRATLVAGASIPISMAVAIAAFPALGASLDVMSLGGFAIAVGLIIDDAIVVVDNVTRRAYAQGESTPARVLAATREVAGAIIGSSLTTIAVFAPMVLLSGVSGQFFRSLSLSLALAIAASVVVSLVYTPLAMMRRRSSGAAAAPRRFMVGLESRYARFVAWALARPRRVLLAVGLVLVSLGFGARHVHTGFLPEMDEGAFVLDYALPPGSSLDATDAVCRRIESILLETPEIETFSRRTGAELGLFATEVSTGDFLVGLTPRDARARSVFELIDALRERLEAEVPVAEIEFIQVMQDTIADLAGTPEPVEVKVMGVEYAALQATAHRIATALESRPELVDVTEHVSFGNPEVAWKVSRTAAGRLGLAVADVVAQARCQGFGTVATRILERDQLVDVRVRTHAAVEVAGDVRIETPWIRGVTPDALPVPLGAIATAHDRIVETELERENQTPLVRVTAGVTHGDLSAAVRAIDETIRDLHLDPGLRVVIGGQIESQARSALDLVEIGVMGSAIVLLLLVVQFRSLRLPFALLTVIPFGLLGALCALDATAAALDVSSGIGLILLVGLAVKNGIIQIECAQSLRRDGSSELDALAGAARLRLRPILMTTLASIAGLTPLALGIGSGAALQRSLAIAVIGGLVVSTTIGLVLVPLAVRTFARDRLTSEDADAA